MILQPYKDKRRIHQFPIIINILNMQLYIFFIAALVSANDFFKLKATTTDDDFFDKTPIKKVDSHPHVFSVGGNEGNDLSVKFQDDGSSLVDDSGRGINVDGDTGEIGNVAPFGREPATPGFSVKDGRLLFNDEDHWRACPSGDDKFSLTNKDGEGCKTIILEVE